MHSHTLSAAALLAVSSFAALTNISRLPDLLPNADILKDATIQSSVGGKAICVSGTIDVTASAQNYEVKLSPPQNQTELTNLILEFSQINSTLEKDILGSQRNISGTYGIYSQLCVPVTPSDDDKARTVQFLVHGGGFDRQYWNNAPDYSYVDFAAEQGYTTFLYDRLGVGLSDHPDALQVVQTTLHHAIAHELIQLLRAGSISSQPFEHVVGVGHSYGSAQILGIAALDPKDLDALVLTGASAEPNGYVLNIVGQVQTIASRNEPLRFADLSNGYALPGSIEGLQLGFFRAPNFDQYMLNLAERTKQPQGLGELVVPLAIDPVEVFTGPIYVVNGENDLPVCLGNCYLPYNKAAELKDMLFPAASNGSGWYIVPGTGHGVNYHYGAREAYAHIHDFISANGF